jgi:hypothetical protein
MKQNFVLFWVAAHTTILLAQSPGTFTATGNMITERNGHTATLLNTGNVLIAGGSANASAELYDPTVGVFTATGNMTTSRLSPTATLLPNGKVLIAGGNADDGTPFGLASAELYDPSTGTFTATANMTAARVWHTAALLNDGKVLIAGGQNRDGALASAELYDPSAETFTPTGNMAVGRSGQFATLLGNGKVLVAPHLDGSGDRTEVYDPVTGVFNDTTGWKNSVDIDGASETVGAATVNSLTNGKILVTLETQGCVFPVANAYLYDPVTGTFASSDPPVYGPCEPASTLLADGTLLLTGGQFASAGLSQFYDPSAGNFSRSGDMITHRGGHTATLLSDGAVLVSGGFQFVGNPLDLSGYHAVILASAEIYHPAVLIPAPALFSLSGDGKGQGAIWDATGQVASPSNPSVAGTVLSMYTTSLTEGGVIPPQVAVGGLLAEILYFGDSPGYPGYNQVNFRVPGGVRPGLAVPVRLRYIGRASNEVTIALK